MQKNLYRLWMILLAASGMIALWFSASAAANLWKFFWLNAHAPAEVLHWEVQEFSASRYAMQAQYQFKMHGKTYSGKTIFENPQFLNHFAAENYMKISGSKSWEVWYCSSNPSYHCLEKNFPKKKCLQALLTIGVCIYFIFAKNMVLKLNFSRS